MQSQHKKTRLTQDIWYEDRIIGCGHFGDVFKGIMISKRQFVAIKKINLFSEEYGKSLERQLEAIKTFNHPNIVKFYQCITIPGTQLHYLVLQYCEGGTLKTEISKNKKLPQQTCLKYLRQIIAGVQSIHKAKFIHRDLKPDNILLTWDENIKICDFGIARFVNQNQIYDQLKMTNEIGTCLYMAPQVYQNCSYSAKCDIWAIGVILYEMCTGTNPFLVDKEQFKVQHSSIKENKHKELLGQYSGLLKQIIKKTLVFNQNDRIDIYQLKRILDSYYQNNLSHSFIEVFDCNQEYSKQAPKEIIPQKSQIFVSQGESKLGFDNIIKNILLNTLTQIERDVAHREQSKTQLSKVRIFIQFLYQRSFEFIRVAQDHLQHSCNLFNQFQKYIGYVIAIAIFYKTLEEIQSILDSQNIQLPGKEIFIVQDIHPSLKIEFSKKRQKYKNIIEQLRSKYKNIFYITKQTIAAQKYNSQFQKSYFDYRHIRKQIQQDVQPKFTQNCKWFQGWFSKLFIDGHSLSAPELKNLEEKYLRIYWRGIKLADAEYQFPISEFQNNKIISQFKDDSQNKPRNQIQDEIIVIIKEFNKRRLEESNKMKMLLLSEKRNIKQ